LTNILEIRGTIELLTGLHIGSGNTEMHIGGSDSPVIRHPHTNHPYIPGSSLKGKMRSLLEWRAGLAAVNDGKPMSYKKLAALPDPAQKTEALRILQLFGVSGGDDLTQEQAIEVGPSRLAFRDCALSPDWIELMKSKNLPLTETKMENMIDRVRGVAEHPRNTERVPAGARFTFHLSMKQLDGDPSALRDTLLVGLRLLEMDSIGGSGSRGYGRIEFQLDGDGYADWRFRAKPW
jgi:CRISPR-associated protein Csm3